MATEQSKSIPPQVGGALRQAFGRNDEAIAVVDELTPSVWRDIPWVSMTLQARQALKPTSETR